MYKIKYITEYTLTRGWQQPQAGIVSSELWQTRKELLDSIHYTIFNSFQYANQVIFKIEIHII